MAIIELKIEDDKYAAIKEAAEYFATTPKEYCSEALYEFADAFHDKKLENIFGPSTAGKRIEQTLLAYTHEGGLEIKKKERRIRRSKTEGNVTKLAPR